MSGDLYNTIRHMIQEELRQIRTAELGVVQEQHSHASDSDDDNYACTVALRNSDIVLPKVPVATQRIGIASIPNINDLVLVQFINGDINAPVITGCFYNDEDRPPVNDDQQWVAQLPLGASESDALQVSMQTGEQREISLQLGDALKVECKDDDPVLTIEVDGGKATIQIDRDGAITMESQSNIQIKSNDFSIKGSSIAIEADGELTLKGSVVNIN
ncbi:MAG: phage baseplate assembly protein V [Gammaproteobacteria bacterium]|nr:phage baseplate assembly protein V [Gammaproteobacteria bacterium]